MLICCLFNMYFVLWFLIDFMVYVFGVVLKLSVAFRGPDRAEKLAVKTVNKSELTVLIKQ